MLDLVKQISLRGEVTETVFRLHHVTRPIRTDCSFVEVIINK